MDAVRRLRVQGFKDLAIAVKLLVLDDDLAVFGHEAGLVHQDKDVFGLGPALEPGYEPRIQFQMLLVGKYDPGPL